MKEEIAGFEEQSWESLFSRMHAELMGCSFSNAMQLRRMVERCGFESVTVEVAHLGDRQAHLVLSASGPGEVHVYADRVQHWHPFYVRVIERAVKI